MDEASDDPDEIVDRVHQKTGQPREQVERVLATTNSLSSRGVGGGLSVPSLPTEIRRLRPEGRDSYGRTDLEIRRQQRAALEMAAALDEVAERLGAGEVELGSEGGQRRRRFERPLRRSIAARSATAGF